MILHYVDGKTVKAEVTKEGRDYTYFTAGSFRRKYRLVKATGDIEVAPYWVTVKGLYVTEEV